MIDLATWDRMTADERITYFRDKGRAVYGQPQFYKDFAADVGIHSRSMYRYTASPERMPFWMPALLSAWAGDKPDGPSPEVKRAALTLTQLSEALATAAQDLVAGSGAPAPTQSGDAGPAPSPASPQGRAGHTG